MKRAVVYVAHPLSGTYAEMQRNRESGAHWCAWLCRHFRVATIADWIVMSSVLLETDENRAMGLDCDKAVIERCDGVILCSTRISGGMSIECGHASSIGKWVADLTPLGIATPSEETSVEAVAALLAPFGVRRVRPPHAAHGPGVFWSTCDGCMFEKLGDVSGGLV